MSFWLWASRLWPIVLALVVLALRRKALANPAAFLVFGALVCFGVQWIVGQFSASWPTAYSGAEGSSDQLFSIALNTLARMVLVSMLLGSALLWWFSRILVENSLRE